MGMEQGSEDLCSIWELLETQGVARNEGEWPEVAEGGFKRGWGTSGSPAGCQSYSAWSTAGALPVPGGMGMQRGSEELCSAYSGDAGRAPPTRDGVKSRRVPGGCK